MSAGFASSGKAAISRLAERQSHEMFLRLGAAVSVLLSLVHSGIRWFQGIPAGEMASAVTLMVLDVPLGAALWASAEITRKSLVNGAIVAAVVSIVLIAFGGQIGVIGGVIGLIGAILAAAMPYLPRSKRDQYTPTQ